MDLTALAAFAGGLIVFFGLHVYSAFRPREAGDIESRIGKGPYKGLYSLLSIAGFVAMIWGYLNINLFINVWTPPTWTRHIAMLLMLPAMILIVAAYVPAGYIKKAAKHPMLLAVILWGLAHVTANGDLVSLILFGSFLIYAIVDRMAVSKRGDSGAAGAKPNVFGDLIALAVGAAIYASLVAFLHLQLFGKPILLPG